MFRIVNLKSVNKGSLKYELSVIVEKWGGFIIHSIKVFEKEGRKWINFPCTEYEKDGEKKYFQLNGFEKPEMKQAFEKKLFDAIDGF